MNDLLHKNNLLQQEVSQIFPDSDLVTCLKTAGDLELVGSAKYGLMTWRDLDFNVITENVPDDQTLWTVIKRLFSLQQVSSITIADNRQGNTESNRPKSMYIGLKYTINTEIPTWKFDIRLLKREDKTTDTVDQLIDQYLTDEKKLDILKIKSLVCDHPKYHKVFSSVDIYEAVLKDNVSSFEELKKYLKKKNINL